MQVSRKPSIRFVENYDHITKYVYENYVVNVLEIHIYQDVVVSYQNTLAKKGVIFPSFFRLNKFNEHFSSN